MSSFDVSAGSSPEGGKPKSVFRGLGPELIVTAFFFSLGTLVVYQAGQITELKVLRDLIGARGFAYFIGGMIMLLSAILFVRQLLAMRKIDGSQPIELDTGDDSRYKSVPARAWAIMALCF